jgi:hypothetical protein
LLTGEDFEVTFVDRAGAERCGPLSRCWDVTFEQVKPVRGFASFPGQSHFPASPTRQPGTTSSNSVERARSHHE